MAELNSIQVGATTYIVHKDEDGNEYCHPRGTSDGAFMWVRRWDAREKCVYYYSPALDKEEWQLPDIYAKPVDNESDTSSSSQNEDIVDQHVDDMGPVSKQQMECTAEEQPIADAPESTSAVPCEVLHPGTTDYPAEASKAPSTAASTLSLESSDHGRLEEDTHSQDAAMCDDAFPDLEDIVLPKPSIEAQPKCPLSLGFGFAKGAAANSSWQPAGLKLLESNGIQQNEGDLQRPPEDTMPKNDTPKSQSSGHDFALSNALKTGGSQHSQGSKPKAFSEHAASSRSTATSSRVSTQNSVSRHRATVQKKIVYPAGSVYQGSVDIETNQRHGNGRWRTHDKSLAYIGEWQNGNKSGGGTMAYPAGRYEGSWSLDLPDGKGVMSYNGFCYNGDFNGGQMSGQGTLRYPNGDQCEGEWAADKRAQRGRMMYTNGDVYEWTWNDIPGTGKATLRYNNGDCLQGATVDFLWNGPGQFTSGTGHCYRGEYKEGAMWGRGRLVFRNGNTYQGEFRANQFHGYGIYDDVVNQNRYEGNWKDGKMHGEGTLTYQTGDQWIGKWANDRKVKGKFVLKRDL